MQKAIIKCVDYLPTIISAIVLGGLIDDGGSKEVLEFMIVVFSAVALVNVIAVNISEYY